jgi:malonyl CoA-acyl carrier protein transacylase
VPKLVFNNPANNKLHVHVPEGISIVTLNLYSITGGKMLSYQGAEPVVDMDISGLSLGIYIAEATLSDGSVSFFKVLKIR